jgi:hypothetical protein
MLKDDELSDVLAAELDAAITVAQAADDGRLALAWQYYDGELPENDDPNEDPHRAAVSLDVADMVEAVYSQMVPAFEDVGGIEFEAMGGDDEPAAARETAIVRAMLMEGRCGEGGFVALTEAIKNALMCRKGTLALWIDRTETHTPEEWEHVPELAVGELISPTMEGQRVEKLTIDREQGDDAADAKTPTGEEAPGATYKVSFTRVDVDKRLAMGAIAPENFVTSSLEERDPNKLRFCADRVVTTRAALVAQGFDESKVKGLKRHNPDSYTLARRRADDASAGAETSAQAATEWVEVWRCYVLLADTKDGASAQRHRVWFSRDSSVIVKKPEKVGQVCYAVGNVMLYPHRMDGVSLFDRIGEVQELKSAGLRNWVENLHKVNRPRLALDESLANLADAKDATQDIIRVKGPNALMPVPSIDAGPSVAAFLQYMDQARSERGGASLDMQASAMQIASNQTAQGIERQYSTKEQLAAVMARTFAETALRQAFLIAHYLLRTGWGGPIQSKVAGEWVDEDPSKWRYRRGVVVHVGQSQSQRQRQQQALGQVLQQQLALQGSGSILVDDARVFNAASDWIGAQQLRSPDRYLIDPASQTGQQAAQARQQQQQAGQQAQGDQMRAAMMLEKYKTDVSALTDLIGHLIKAAIEEAKLTLSPDPIDVIQAQAESAAKAASEGAGEVGQVVTQQLGQQQQRPGNGAAGPAGPGAG